jgi:RNA polymerase sigma-70 factor (ECF subfamily)
MSQPFNVNPGPSAGQLPSTLWSVVLRARDRSAPEAEEALAQLCRVYWYPLYVYIRRQVGSTDQAEDLTQAFFTRLLEKDFLAAVDRGKGKFRAFLLACCKHFLANERDRQLARKRGGGRPVLSLDFPLAGERYRLEPADTLSPDRHFQRSWALLLLDQVLNQLCQEYQESGKGALYEHLKGALLGEHAALSCAELGAAVGMTEAAVKKAAQRLRQRYRELLKERIAATVEGPEAVEEEIRELFAVLGSG